MPNTVLGWDIGGAHLKAVLIDENGKALHAWQLATPLWQGLGKLTTAMDAICNELGTAPDMHAVTMTGELADIFADRKSGVQQISRAVDAKLDSPRFYAGPKGFVGLDGVLHHSMQIASANWYASAAYIAQQVPGGLFIDMGSTTCDLIPLYDGRVCNRGYSDAERMQHEELVYTGVVRTPLMALASHIAFDGRQYPLAAEHFATTADVYRLTAELDESHDLADTADGKGKTMEDSARRLARMLCHDVAEASIEQWIKLAYAFRQCQLDRLMAAANSQYAAHVPYLDGPIIGAGAGSFLVDSLAKHTGREYRAVADFITTKTTDSAHGAAVCFPAYAVAQLALGNAG